MADQENKVILAKKDEDQYEKTFLTTLEKGKSDRGFGFYQFKDKYGQKCSLQDSSLATEPAIWFGVDINMKGEKVQYRMHLTQEQVKELLPILTHFAETGKYVRDFEDNIDTEIKNIKDECSNQEEV